MNDLILEYDCIKKIFDLIKNKENENSHLINAIETQKEITESRRRQLTQLVNEYNELNEKLNNLDEKLQQQQQLNQITSSLDDTQHYIEYSLKETKDKCDIYLEQIDYYKELFQFDIKLDKKLDNKLITITFLKNNQQITLNCTNLLVTYEENIEDLIENCKYESVDAIIKKFNQTNPKSNETIKELILSLNNIF